MYKRSILEFKVLDEYDNWLLRNFLRKYCQISAQLLIDLKKEHGAITVNDIHTIVTRHVNKGDIIKLTLPLDKSDVKPIDMPIDIVYEDEHLLIVNKPENMPVHPTSCGHTEDTLANAVSFYMEQKNETYKIRAINRLDKDTKGLVVITKNSFTAYQLAKNIKKTYLAVCEGEVVGKGTVNAKIDREEGRSIKRIVSSSGQSAVTHYTPIKYNNGHTLVKMELETGRTHQIRVHMSHIGHPLAGDDMYGGKMDIVKTQSLYCVDVSFIHPVTHEDMFIKINIDKNLEPFGF